MAETQWTTSPPTESDADFRGCVSIADCQYYPWKIAANENRPWRHSPLWSRTEQIARMIYDDLGSNNFSVNSKLQALLLIVGNLRAQLANTEGAADCYLQLCLAMDHIRNARNLTHKLNERL
jgi:hypothetical protein